MPPIIMRIEVPTTPPHAGEIFVHQDPLAGGAASVHRTDVIQWFNHLPVPVRVIFSHKGPKIFTNPNRIMDLPANANAPGNPTAPGGVRTVDPAAPTNLGKISYVAFRTDTLEFGIGEASDPEIEVKP